MNNRLINVEPIQPINVNVASTAKWLVILLVMGMVIALVYSRIRSSDMQKHYKGGDGSVDDDFIEDEIEVLAKNLNRVLNYRVWLDGRARCQQLKRVLDLNDNELRALVIYYSDRYKSDLYSDIDALNTTGCTSGYNWGFSHPESEKNLDGKIMNRIEELGNVG